MGVSYWTYMVFDLLLVGKPAGETEALVPIRFGIASKRATIMTMLRENSGQISLKPVDPAKAQERNSGRMIF